MTEMEKSWRSYREQAIPDAGPQQVIDLQLAFYAGAAALNAAADKANRQADPAAAFRMEMEHVVGQAMKTLADLEAILLTRVLRCE